MKIPIFEEITLKGHSSAEIHASLEDSRIGKVPAYINLHQVKNDELETLVMNLEQVILELHAHPRFPYPLFLITKRSLHSLIPTVRTVSELPEHYFRKVKRPNNKELQLLNKLSLKVDKIKNLELYKVMEKLKESADDQKRLYRETKELYFLEAVHAKLFPVVKPKTKGHS